jgi:hypothetical protein
VLVGEEGEGEEDESVKRTHKFELLINRHRTALPFSVVHAKETSKEA